MTYPIDYIYAIHYKRGIKLLFSIWYTEQFPDKVDNQKMQMGLSFLSTWLLNGTLWYLLR